MSGGGARLTLSGPDVFSLRQPLPSLASARGREKPRGLTPELPSTTLLLPPQGQQLGVDREDLAHRFLELPSAPHPLAYPRHPLFRNPLHPLTALEHESERPNRVASPLGAMTGCLTAATVSLGQGAGKAVGRQADMGQELAFAAPQARRLTTLRTGRADLHLSVIIHSDSGIARTFVGRFFENPRKGYTGSPKYSEG